MDGEWKGLGATVSERILGNMCGWNVDAAIAMMKGT